MILRNFKINLYLGSFFGVFVRPSPMSIILPAIWGDFGDKSLGSHDLRKKLYATRDPHGYRETSVPGGQVS